jgi:hypothetical protein
MAVIDIVGESRREGARPLQLLLHVAAKCKRFDARLSPMFQYLDYLVQSRGWWENPVATREKAQRLSATTDSFAATATDLVPRIASGRTNHVELLSHHLKIPPKREHESV